MNVNQNIADRISQLVAWYGDGGDGSSPTAEQWRALLTRPADAPVSLVNFFKFRDRAQYPDSAMPPAEAGTGQDAFRRYAAVSVPTLEHVGGRFLLRAPFEAALVGDREDWDLVVVGAYPNTAAVLALFEDPDYRKAFVHRTAACARQQVMIAAMDASAG